MEAGELDHRLGDLHLDSIHFLGESGERQPAVNHYLAALRDGLQHAVADAVPAIYVDPHRFVFVRVGRELFHRHREFDHLVARVSEGDFARSLTDVPDYCDRIIHDFLHLRACVFVPGPVAQAEPAQRLFEGCKDAERPGGVALQPEKSCASLGHIKDTCREGAKYEESEYQSGEAVFKLSSVSGWKGGMVLPAAVKGSCRRGQLGSGVMMAHGGSGAGPLLGIMARELVVR